MHAPSLTGFASGSARRVAVALGFALALGSVIAGCGSQFPLPTESRARLIPGDGTYQRVADWSLPGVVDALLVPKGTLSQLYFLHNYGGAGTAPRGELLEYVLVRPEPYSNRVFAGLFNPVAVASGDNRLFVLDQGDTCIARANPQSGLCNDTSGGWRNAISDVTHYWWARKYMLTGGSPESQFTDTSLVFVTGIAADADNNVYVGGVRSRYVPNQDEPRLRDRLFEFGVWRYAPGLRADGKVDPFVLPAASWHRDTTFELTQGTGSGSVVDSRGIFWGQGPYGSLIYACDFGNNAVKKAGDQGVAPGLLAITGSTPDSLLVRPLDVSADPQGFIYVVDGGNRRVLRFDNDGNFIQRVNVEGDALLQPVAVAADDSLCFVADPGGSRVIRYKRRN
jgi:hypothetical protein